jgi:hypothetical protein
MSCPPDKKQLQALAAAQQKIKSITNKLNSFGVGSIIKGLGAKLIPASLKNLGNTANVQTRQDHAGVIEDTASKLAPIETEMSPGGTEIISYTNDLHITVGGKFVSSQSCPPIRKTLGLPVIEKIEINNDRTDAKLSDAPYVETLSHPVPWGNYSILANNSFNLVVGANGIVVSTEGNYDVNAFGVSTISSLHGLNLTTSEGNLNIICGNHVQIVGKTVNIQTCNENDQVVINSNLGIKKNAVVHGSLYVDGEIYAQHLTTPAQTQETSETMAKAFLPPEQVIAYADIGPLITWITQNFALISASIASQIPMGPHAYIYMPVIPANMYYPGMKLACRSFEYFGTGIPNGTWSMMPAGPVGSVFDPLSLAELHSTDNANKAVSVLPHNHQYYGPASSKLQGNGDVRDAAASIINSGSTGEAQGVVHGGSGLHV